MRFAKYFEGGQIEAMGGLYEHTWDRCEMHSVIWVVNMKGGDHLEDLTRMGR
jgi:hypothetical protein